MKAGRFERMVLDVRLRGRADDDFKSGLSQDPLYLTILIDAEHKLTRRSGTSTLGWLPLESSIRAEMLPTIVWPRSMSSAGCCLVYELV
jgi:hypothetical protein